MDMGLSWWDCCVSKNPTILLIIITFFSFFVSIVTCTLWCSGEPLNMVAIRQELILLDLYAENLSFRGQKVLENKAE